MKSKLKADILDLLKKSLGDDYEDFIQVFIKDTTQLISTIDDAVESNNSLVLSDSAHKLKGSMATLGAVRMSELSCKLENINKDLNRQQLNQIVVQLKIEFDEVKEAIATHAPN